MCIEWVMPSSHLILWYPLFLLLPVPPSIRVFSNESTLCMRQPKYWSFSLSISPSNEHAGLVSFSSFQISNAVLLTLVPMMYIISSKLIHLLAGSLHLLTTFTQCSHPAPPTCGNHRFVFHTCNFLCCLISHVSDIINYLPFCV